MGHFEDGILEASDEAKIMLTHVGSAAREQKLTEFCEHCMVRAPSADVPE